MEVGRWFEENLRYKVGDGTYTFFFCLKILRRHSRYVFFMVECKRRNMKVAASVVGVSNELVVDWMALFDNVNLLVNIADLWCW